MRRAHDDDRLWQAMASLPAVEPDVAQADRIRARCRAALQRPSSRGVPVRLAPASIGALCTVYAWRILRIVLR